MTPSGNTSGSGSRIRVAERFTPSRRRTFWTDPGCETASKGSFTWSRAATQRRSVMSSFRRGATLLDSVPATDLQEVLKRIDVDAISPPACSVLPELRGDALRAIGHLQPALQEYRNALSLAEEHRQADRSPSLLRKIASIERCRAD